jgi:hypothetical protein
MSPRPMDATSGRGREPTREELLSDPIIVALMAADGVDPHARSDAEPDRPLAQQHPTRVLAHRSPTCDFAIRSRCRQVPGPDSRAAGSLPSSRPRNSTPPEPCAVPNPSGSIAPSADARQSGLSLRETKRRRTRDPETSALGEESALPVAQILTDRHIPFVFMTGASESPEGRWHDVPALLKPFTFEELRRALQHLLSEPDETPKSGL